MMNRSTLWRHKTAPEDLETEVIDLAKERRARSEAHIVAKVKEITDRFPTWGYRRVCAWLRNREDILINRKRVRRMMRQYNLQVRLFNRTPRPRVQQWKSEVDVSDTRWAIDMTSTWCEQDGWLGIFAIIDCHDREIVAIHVSKHGRATEAQQTLEAACIHRFGLAYPKAEDARPVLRSDNGKVFTSKAFTACSKQYGLEQEFITPYTPQQNGMIERFFRSLKEECIWLHNFETYEQAKEIIEEWVEFYNTQRPHQSLGYLSPAEHRAQYSQHVA
jgi:putative transposase